MEGKKFDQKKPPMILLPTQALTEVAKVLDFGTHKYGAWNWRHGMNWDRMYSAAIRHLFAWNEGEDFDTETGLNHLAHAACCILFLLTYTIIGVGLDNRFNSLHPSVDESSE